MYVRSALGIFADKDLITTNEKKNLVINKKKAYTVSRIFKSANLQIAESRSYLYNFQDL